MVVDYVRNVLRVEDADHAETNPEASHLAVTPLSCSLVGQEHVVRMVAGTRTAALYGCTEAVESFYCSYGVNSEYRSRLEAAGLVVSAVDADGEVRVMEMATHPFYVGTLFVPQVRSAPGSPHPLLTGFVAAARAYRAAAS